MPLGIFCVIPQVCAGPSPCLSWQSQSQDHGAEPGFIWRSTEVPITTGGVPECVCAASPEPPPSCRVHPQLCLCKQRWEMPVRSLCQKHCSCFACRVQLPRQGEMWQRLRGDAKKPTWLYFFFSQMPLLFVEKKYTGTGFFFLDLIFHSCCVCFAAGFTTQSPLCCFHRLI